MKILVCNVGSTSLKFKLYQFQEDAWPGSVSEQLTLRKPVVYTLLARAGVERVGSRDDALFRYVNEETGASIDLSGQDIPDSASGWTPRSMKMSPRMA